MATLAVTAAITVGGMLLQSLFAPKIKQEPIDKGKFDDIRIQGFDYGAYVPSVWGTVRLGANTIFSSGIDHEIIEQPTQGGKGVPSAPATRTHIYRTDVGLLFCRGTLEKFGKVWADADLIVNDGTLPEEEFLEAEAATLAGTNPPTLLTDADFAPPASNNGIRFPSGAGGTATFTASLTQPAAPIEPSTPRPRTRIEIFYKSTANVTLDVTVNGITTVPVTVLSSGGNYAVWSVTIENLALSIEIAKTSSGATFDLDKVSLFEYFESVDFPDQFNNISMQVNPDIDYPLNLDDPSAYYNYKSEYDADGQKSFTTSNAAAIRMYLGSETQDQDASLMAWLDKRFGSGQGAARASAMRGLAYITLDNRVLRQGRLENFTAECVQSSSAVSVNTIIEDIGSRVGLSSGDFEFDTNPPRTVAGYLDTQPTSYSQMIEPILRWSQRRLADLDGKVKVIYDGPIGEVWDITDQQSYTYAVDHVLDMDLDVRGHTYGDAYPEYNVEVTKKEPGLQPLQTKVSYLNRLLEYHNDTADSEPHPSTDATDISEFAFPVVSEPKQAKTISDELQRKATYADTAFQWVGTPNMAKYTVGDTVQIPVGSKTIYARIERCQRQFPHGTVLYQALRTDKLTPGDDPSFAPDSFKNEAVEIEQPQFAYPKPPRNSIIDTWESVPIREQDKGKVGIYMGVAGRGFGYWENGALYREFDADNYEFQRIIDSPSPMGHAQSTLANVADHTVEDTVNSLEIYFFDDVELESVVAKDLEDFPTRNLIRVGNEWIQFRTAVEGTVPTASTYRSVWTISNLKRGRFDTESVAETSGHVADEVCTVITKAIQFVELDRSDIATDINFKAVTADQQLENAPIHTHSAFSGVTGDWTVTNDNANRTLDADATTLGDLADNVATITTDTNLR